MPSRRRIHAVPKITSHRTRGAALHLAVGLIAMGALAWAGISSVWPGGSTVPRMAKSTTLPPPPPPPPAIEVEAALGQLGLTPKVMAAANLTAEQTSAFATAAATYIRDHIDTYRSAKESVATARGVASRLRKLIQGTKATEQQLTDLATAEAALTTARNQQAAVLTAALTAGGEQISAPALSLLNTFRANHLAWSIPERFLGDGRSEAEWVALRDAVANDRIAATFDIEPDPAAHQLLLAAQGTTNSSAANTNMANFAAIQSAWTAAMGQ